MNMENPVDMVEIEENLKSGKLLSDFFKYCRQNSGEGFWQALRNWSGSDFIYKGNMTSKGEGTRVVIDGVGLYIKDTFNEQ